MTKTEAAQVARQARRYGYYSVAGGVEVECPRCRRRVRGYQGYHYRPAKHGEAALVDGDGKRVVSVRDTVTYAIDRAMVDHLMEGSCP